jgi:2-(1,2-epoxy-1,2-dihydrophenyl)acetyl-CoA isomerase
MNDSFDTGLETQMDKERRAISECGSHKDGEEGLAAFLEKRRPCFAPAQKPET